MSGYYIHETENFRNIETKEIILRRQSIKNWLENSGTNDDIRKDIFNIHIQSSKDIKKMTNMVEENGDILCDWKFVIIKCRK